MKKVNLAYMAGIFDGEGCISISHPVRKEREGRRYYILYASIGMANEYIANLFQFTFGGSVAKVKVREGCRSIWQWQIAAQQAKTFLKILLPYLRLKRNEAELAIQFQGAKYIRRKTEKELAIEEAQYILLSAMKDKSQPIVNSLTHETKIEKKTKILKEE